MPETEAAIVIPESLRYVPGVLPAVEATRTETELTHEQIAAVLSHLQSYGLLREDHRYNGWTNYETWCIHLWLTNEEGTYNYCRALARQAAEDAPDCEQVADRIWTVDDAKKFLLADQLKEFVAETNPLSDKASMFSDLLGAAISESNWDEIAGAFLDE